MAPTPRLDAMIEQIKVLKSDVVIPLNQTDIKSFDAILDGLEEFAENFYQSFVDGFENGYLEKQKGVPPDYVSSTILDHVAEDLDIIRMAICQRKNTQLYKTLEGTDKIGQKILADAAKTYKLSENFQSNAKVVSFFCQSYNVRVIPYANVIFIGIPYTCKIDKINNQLSLTPNAFPQDFLAIAHEMGHYIFWKTSFQADIRPYSNKRNEIIQKWAEEIFADIFGLVMDGPTYVIGFQDLFIRRSNNDDLLADDGEHPQPIVRPQLLINALRVQPARQEYKEWAQILEAFWDYETKKRGFGLDVIFLRSSLNTSGLDSFVQEILTKSFASKNPQAAIIGLIPPVYPNLSDDQNLRQRMLQNPASSLLRDEVYRIYGDKINDILSPTTAVNYPVVQKISWVDFVNSINSEYSAILTPPIPNTIPLAWKTPNPNKNILYTLEQWACLLQADGWVTRGPWSRKR